MLRTLHGCRWDLFQGTARKLAKKLTFKPFTTTFINLENPSICIINMWHFQHFIQFLFIFLIHWRQIPSLSTLLAPMVPFPSNHPCFVHPNEVKSVNYEAPRYVIFSILLLIPVLSTLFSNTFILYSSFWWRIC
jgi:hypothetical protein